MQGVHITKIVRLHLPLTAAAVLYQAPVHVILLPAVYQVPGTMVPGICLFPIQTPGTNDTHSSTSTWTRTEYQSIRLGIHHRIYEYSWSSLACNDNLELGVHQFVEALHQGASDIHVYVPVPPRIIVP